jgi:deoxyribonuclease IV
MIKLGPAGFNGDFEEGLMFLKKNKLRAVEIPFTYGVRMTNDTAKKIAILNEKTKISISVHAPYYINLAAKENEKIIASKKRIMDSCERAHHMGGNYVVFHPGFIMQRKRSDVYEMIYQNIAQLQDSLNSQGFKNVKLAPETTGKISQFGDIDELLKIRKEIGCELCVDFAHLYARNQGNIDWNEIFNKLKGIKHIHSHCSGIEFGDKGEKKHKILEKEFFKPIAKQILKRKLDITIISESPVTWEDSLKMKQVFNSLKPQSI